MTEQEGKRLGRELLSFSVFRKIIETETMSALTGCLTSKKDSPKRSRKYGEFVCSLADHGCSFSDFLRANVLTDENKYIIQSANGGEISASLRKNTYSELKILSSLTELKPADLAGEADGDFYVPEFENTPADFEAEYRERIKKISRYGYGVLSTSIMFRVTERGGTAEIVPIENPDRTTEESLIGYTRERKLLFDNTRALIEGKPAANALLFGYAGTGKSSTVKACANRFAEEGVRLIELRRDQLTELPEIMGRLRGNPLKFIIFIDDLSFTNADGSFSMLKAALEGSASAKAPNTVIYATSNRRHAVKETFSERESSDDVHRGDTMQELLSLSERFGLTIGFEKPNKAQYLEIVHGLAERAGIGVTTELDTEAEAFALRRGSRSPRAAEQFIESQISKG